MESMNRVNVPRKALAKGVSARQESSILETFNELGWMKWPIVGFAILSFVFTASGIAALIPPAVPLIATWIASLLVSACIQYLMLGSALEIARNGIRLRWLAFYLLMAVPSVFFSYVAMYKFLVEDAFTAKRQARQQELFDQYRQDTMRDLGRALSALDVAIAEVEVTKVSEERLGGTGSFERVSPYLKTVLTEVGFDTRNDQAASGKGRVHARWQTVETVLTKRKGLVSQWKQLPILMEPIGSDAELLDKARRIESQIDRSLLQRVLEGEGYETFSTGIPAEFKAEFAQPEDARTAELLLMSRAWNDLGDKFDEPLVRASAFWATVFDAVAFLLAVVSVRNASETVVDERVGELLRDLTQLSPAAPKAAFLLSQRMHSRGKLVDRWYLDLDDLQRMDQLERLIVSRLEDLGLVRSQRLRGRIAVTSTARNVLRRLGTA